MKKILIACVLLLTSGCATMGGALQGFGQGMQHGINQGSNTIRCTSHQVGINTYASCR